MRKEPNPQAEQKKREWIEFVMKNRGFFEKLARKVKR